MSASRQIRPQETPKIVPLAERKAVGTAPAPGGAALRSVSARIGKYEVEDEIGHTPWMKAFRAFDRDTGRNVILRVLTDVGNRPAIERFRREVAAAANLRTRQMVAIYELGEHVGLPFAALQDLGKDHLRQLIREQRPLTLLQKMLIMWQVAEGAQAAHRGGLSYVGIRPSGIALPGDGAAVIQDFGIVRVSGEDADDGFAYAAPEQAAAGFDPDLLCDVFAFGVVYYELLTGTHPFGLQEQPLPLRDLASDCPEDLERLIFRALEKERELRYQSLDDVQYDAEPILRELKHGRASALLAEGRRLLDSQELDEAQTIIREVLELDPENRKAQRMRTAVRDLLQRRAAQARVEALLREAGEQIAARRFVEAAEILQSALRLDAENPEARARLEEIGSRLEQSRRHAQLLAEARTLAGEQNLAEARVKASAALDSDPDSSEALELLVEIDEALERREKQARIEQELAKAQSLLLLESFDAALAILEGLRPECDAEVLDPWFAHVETQKAEAERKHRLQAELGSARALLARREYAESIRLLETLSAQFPREAAVSDLLGQARLALTRADAVVQALQESQWLMEQDRPDLALPFLRGKSAELAGDAALLARLAEVEAILPDWEKRRFVEDTLNRVAALEQQQQWSVALTVLEEALEAHPAFGELLGPAERLRSRLREQERRKKLARKLEAVSQKISSGAWAQALSLLEAAQAEFPGEPELQPLSEKIQAGMRRSQCDSIISDVRQCLADGETSLAEETLRKGLDSLPQEPSLEALRQELEAGKKYREEFRAAQVLFGRRQFQEAERILVRLAAEDRPEVHALLETVREARADSEEENFYRRGREKALKLIQQKQLEQAADLLRNLLSLFPEDAILLRDLQSIGAPVVVEPKAPEPEVQPIRESAVPPAPWPKVAIEEHAATGRLPVTIPPRWAILAGAGVLLVSGSTVVWRASHSGKSAPPAVARQIPAARPVPVPAAVQTAAPAPPLVAEAPAPRVEPPKHEAVDPPDPPTKPAPPAPRAFHPPAPSRPEPVRASAPLPLPPGAVQLAGTSTILPAGVVPPVNEPAPPVKQERPPQQAQAEQPAQRTKAVPGGNLREPELISHPLPAMPALAVARDIHGTVKLEATVDKTGRVTSVSVVSGNPILVPAARDAVSRWRYRPATLNGQPIEVKAQIDLVFETRR
ncbi:MAG TPA: TonB family protein [Bryobacteraceae bacterium]|nr:TonB family protein [Bryobacteraceae bacterium]